VRIGVFMRLAILSLLPATWTPLPAADTSPLGDALSLPSAIYVDSQIGQSASGVVEPPTPPRKLLTYAISVQPLQGKVKLVDPGKGAWEFAPAKGRIGPDRFEISASNGSSTAKTKIVVLVHDIPSRVTYYVDGVNGRNTGDGKSEATAFATIQAAQDATKPGDTVLIKNGTYLQSGGEAVIHIKRSGAPGAKITYKAFPGHKPILTATTAWNHVLITASYIRVEGLEIRGNAANISKADSNAVYERFVVPANRTWGPETSFVNTNGIFVRPENSTAPLFERIAPRHIEIIGNTVSEVPGGGIATDMADYVTIAFNTVHDTAYRSVFANSGISLFHPLDTDTNYTAYKNIIRNNIAHSNRSEIKWFAVQKLSDGNGIILDDTRNTQIKGVPYKGRSLIANNIVFDNGGAGIQTYSSDNVDIVHNTAYHNTKTPELDWGQILARTSSKVRILNNIIVTAPGKRVNENDRTTDTLFDYNLYFGGRQPDVMGPNDRIADPQFVPAKSSLDRNFMLSPGSPAIDTAEPFGAIKTDILGNPRIQGGAPDRGAFEFVPK
jgi:parallel beta-helix repeat protein